MARQPRSLIAPILFGVIGTAILIALGTWQMQRIAWKEALIAEIEAQMAADPVPLPDDASPETELLRVTATGKLGRREIHVISSIKRVGPGFRMIVPMEIGTGDTGSGRRVLVDLGFIPERLKSQDTRADGIRFKDRAFADRVMGFLRWPDETDGMTPEPDVSKNIWFARDVALMAEHLDTEEVLIIAETHPDAAKGAPWPRPQPPGTGLPNRHLEYALTWFGLGMVWIVMTIVWVASMRRSGKAEPEQS